MTVPIVPAHMGDLHAYEQALVWLLAFGPFVVLFVVVYVVRRRDLAEDESESEVAAQEAESEEPVSGPAS